MNQKPPLEPLHSIVEVSAPSALSPILIGAIVGACIGAVLGLITYLLHRRRRKAEAANDFYAEATARLDQLSEQQSELTTQQLSSALSRVLREYVAADSDDAYPYEMAEETLRRTAYEMPHASSLRQFIQEQEKNQFSPSGPESSQAKEAMMGLAKVALKELNQSLKDDSEG